MKAKTFKHFVTAGFLALMATLMLAPPGQGQDPVVFARSRNLSNSSGDSVLPQIAVNRQGNVYAVWQDPTPGVNDCQDIFYSRSANGFSPFSPPVNLSATSACSQNPQLAVDGQGRVSVVWEEFSNGFFTDIFFAHSADGVTFSSRNLSSTAADSRNPQLAVDGQGNAYVVWEESTSGTYDIFFSRSNDGVNFSTPVDLSASPGGSPQLAVDGQENVYLAWAGCAGICFSRSSDGVNFSAPVSVSASSGFLLQTAALAVDGQGNVSVLWLETADFLNFDIFFSRSTDGVDFSAPVNLSADAGNSLSPQLAVDAQGNVSVVWLGELPPASLDYHVFFTRSTDGANFSAPVNLSAGVGSSGQPDLAVDGQGSVSVVWQEGHAFDLDIFFRGSSDGVNFSAPVNVSENAGSSGQPDLAVHARGHAYVVWADDTATPGKLDILFSRTVRP